MERVFAYIDGYNLYHGLKAKGWRWAYWLNIQALMQNFLKPGQSLTKTKYFTTVVATPADKRARQAVFLEALQTLPDFEIYYGKFLWDVVTCRQCGHRYTDYHEKMTDVNIATELLVDSFTDQYDVALLLSADSDLVGPLKAVQRLFHEKQVIVLFPPERSSKELMKYAHGFQYVSRSKLNKSLFPDTVVKPNGYELKRPPHWR